MTQTFLSTSNPKLLLVISRALAALRPALIAFLVTNATRLSGGMESPISFCNVLFVGNLCAAFAVMVWFGLPAIVREIRTHPPKLILGLFLNGCLAALLSSLIFTGLQDTSVTNAVLIGRLGPVIYALVGTLLLGRRLRAAEWLGFGLIIAGIAAIVLKTSEFQINRGDLLILGSAFVYATSSLLGKVMLTGSTSLSTVVFSRNFVSAVVFFIVVSVLFEPVHFIEVFSGQLWIVMSIYALVIIVLAQFLWYAALEKLDSKTVGKWTVLSPVFGVLFAFLLNGERPSLTQAIAFVVIMTGICITNFGRQVTPVVPKEMAGGAESCASAS
ncbi:MAG: DMT family transporter [Cyanobacteria bacterium J06638_20]